MTTEFKIDGITLKLTCESCPEQYDAFNDKNELVGYLRVRHGYFTVNYPNVSGKQVFSSEIDGDGNFSNEREREVYLKIAVIFINYCISKTFDNDYD